MEPKSFLLRLGCVRRRIARLLPPGSASRYFDLHHRQRYRSTGRPAGLCGAEIPARSSKLKAPYSPPPDSCKYFYVPEVMLFSGNECYVPGIHQISYESYLRPPLFTCQISYGSYLRPLCLSVPSASSPLPLPLCLFPSASSWLIFLRKPV